MRPSKRARLGLPTRLSATLVGLLALGGASRADVPAPPVAPASPPAAPAPVSPAPPAPASVEATGAPTGAPPGDGQAAAPVSERVAPIPTADETPPPSDHDAVVHHLGIEARSFDPGPLPLALRAGFGCPIAQTAPCDVTMGALAVRYWTSRNLAWNLGLAFTAGGGRDGGQALDTYLGVGPILGFTLLLANWRHLAVGASPELAVVWFRPGPSAATSSTTVIDLRGALEAELHFGFVGVPALSVGIIAGLGFQYESVADARVWSVGVIGADSAWGVLSNLFIRYYL